MKVDLGYVEVNGAKIYYELAGRGDPIVLIHGNFGECRFWDDQFRNYAESQKVLRYDCRGFGKSSMPVEGEPYSHSDDLKNLMDHLAISKAHICGISMGCALAVDFTLAYPDMSKSLIAVGPWVFGYTSPKAEVLYSVMREMSGIFKEKGSKEALDLIFEHISSCYKGSKRHQRIREIGMDYSFWHFTHDDPLIYLKPPSSQQLSRIRIPSLIITSEYDYPACIEIADLMEREIPNSQKVVIKNASHLMNIDKPEDFNKLVLDFIGGL